MSPFIYYLNHTPKRAKMGIVHNFHEIAETYINKFEYIAHRHFIQKIYVNINYSTDRMGNRLEMRHKSELFQKIELKFDIQMNLETISQNQLLSHSFMSQQNEAITPKFDENFEQSEKSKQFEQLNIVPDSLKLLSLNEKRKKIREAFLECNQDLYLEAGEKHIIMSYFGLSEQQFKNLFISSRQNKRDLLKLNYTQSAIDLNKKTTLPSSSIELNYDKSSTNSNKKLTLEESFTSHSENNSGRMKLLPNQQEFIQNWFVTNEYRMPSLHERDLLSHQLNLTRKQLYYLFLKLHHKYQIDKNIENHYESIRHMNYEMNVPSQNIRNSEHSNHHSFSSKDISLREYLRNWIRIHGASPTFEQKNIISKQFKVTIFQINKQIQAFMNQKGIITEERKKLVLDTFRDYDLSKRTTEKEENILNDLITKTGLSKDQILNICFREKRKINSISPEVKKKIRLQIKKFDTFSQLNEEYLENISKEFGISVNLLSQFMIKEFNERNKITPERKRIILHWFKNNQFKMPTHEERLHLQALTELGPRTLNDAIKVLFSDPNGTLTIDKKAIIEKFIQNHDYLLPTFQHRKELKELTHLSSSQISQFIIELLQRPESISDKSKEFIHIYIEQQCNGICPSLIKLQVLYSKLPNNHKYQINICIHNYLKQKLNCQSNTFNFSSNNESYTQLINDENIHEIIYRKFNQTENFETIINELIQKRNLKYEQNNVENNQEKLNNENKGLIKKEWIHFIQIYFGFPKRTIDKLLKKYYRKIQN